MRKLFPIILPESEKSFWDRSLDKLNAWLGNNVWVLLVVFNLVIGIFLLVTGEPFFGSLALLVGLWHAPYLFNKVKSNGD